MTREDAIQYVSFQVDDGNNRQNAGPGDVNADDRLVGFRQGPDTVFVAVRSHLPGVRVTDEIATDLAREYLEEIGWFGEGAPLEADFIF